ncbi:MAG: hypothetical protein EWV76_07330 [Microcystis novacekii Mn_MB_F_20050700_S1]|uniref:Uncharacterized protein n=1 Tax=Microcystis novacekii Mn_MB_F_20050700_S1D TaxID=2486266 RepID=A0A552IWU6_9CHRO|nr:MAG: hypothetical protein EWV54_11535 [Microcystis novacekii Mn_MB_F_20050700_S1D]TRU89471.1 MAG: hypothetical protein EWV76_07330 [Microcystis novacekii Mn_MB_F_20050700_S1]
MNQKIANYAQGDINIDKQNIYNYPPNQQPPQPNPHNLYQISKSMTDIHARMLAKPAFVVTQIKKNGII